MIPPQFIYYVGNWSCRDGDNLHEWESKVNDMSKEGWELVSISAGIAYWRRANLEYLAYIEAENEKRLRRLKRK